MDNSQIEFNKAIIFENKGELYKAELTLKEITEKYKDYKDIDLVYNKLGVYSHIRKDFNTAIMYFKKALEINSHTYITYKCIGLVYKDSKDYNKAIECFEKYLYSNEDDIEIIYDLADCYIQFMDWEKALNWCKKVINLDCNYKDINLCIGLVNSKLGNLKEADYYYRNQLRKTPNCVNTLNNIACLFSSMAKSNQSIEFFQDMLKNIKKDKYNYYSNYLLELNYTLLFNEEFVFNEHFKFNEFLQITPKHKFNNDLNPNKKLKIAYVSADFRLHSVAYFIFSQLALHNKEYFEFYCYSDVTNSDFVTEQIKSYVYKFKEIKDLKDEEVFNLILKDGIDILVDLSGHAGKNRLPVFAMKPAPIQITMIGYPNTTGIKAMDYRITDKYCDEEGVNDKYYTEKLIRMNKSFLCYSNFEGVPDVKKAEYKEEIVFGSFNNISKLTDEMIKVWCEILKKVDKSKLILKSKAYNDNEAAKEMKKRFLDNGLEEEKIELIAKHSTIDDHLNSYNGIDIALDTFPYNGTTTTCEAMFMGVPVITLAGKRHASRVGVSILTNIGLEELIAHSTKEYVEKAVELAKNRERIKFLNENLRTIMLKSPLMDSISYVKELEKIFRQLWIKWSENQRGESIFTNKGDYLNMHKTKSQLGEKPMNSKYYLETSMDSRNIIRIVNEEKKIYIGSKYSVERDINKFNESLNHINGNTVIIVFGIGCGEHIKELLKKLGDANKIIIIEPSKEIANLFLNMEYSKDILQDTRVKLFDFNSQNIEDVINKNIEVYQVDNIKVISFANYSVIFEEEFRGLNQSLRKISMNKRIGRDTIAFFSQSLFQNFIKNLKNSAGYGVINFYKDLFKSKPAIIVSAGPSLEKNIHLLKEVQNEFVIICGARTLKALTSIGVTPDFVCAVDPQDITYTIMKNELNCNVPLVFMESANYKLVSEYKGPKILFSNEGMETYIESIAGKEVDSLMQGGSVAHVCMGLAYYLGCNPIIFIGQDLAYTGDKFHAESTKAMENPGDVAVTEYEKNKEQWQKMIGQNIYVKDINGELVRTSAILNSYKEEFEDLIEKCQGVTFINSTEGGAHMNGTEVIALKETIEKYTKGEFDKNIDFTDIIKEDTIKDNLISIKNNLMSIKNACKKGIVYADKMYLYYINQKKVNINDIFQELDKVDLVINDIKKVGIIAYLLAPYIETILNDERYVEKLNESQIQTGKRVAKKSKDLYETILKAIDEALQYMN